MAIGVPFGFLTYSLPSFARPMIRLVNCNGLVDKKTGFDPAIYPRNHE